MLKHRVKEFVKKVLPAAAVNILRQCREMFYSLYGDYAIYKIKQGKWDRAFYHQLYRIRNRERYIQYLKYVQAEAVNRIKCKEKIKIAFQVSLISTWIGDEILERFIHDERFDVSVVLVWQINTDRDKEMEMLKRHFYNIEVKVLHADGRLSPRDFDIILYTSPYLSALENWTGKGIPLTTLTCHIPYGLQLDALEEIQFNLFLHNICWKNFAPYKYYLNMAEHYCKIGTVNMVYTGYPKLDSLMCREAGKYFQWKTTGKSQKVKKIIYAPHHSINEAPFYTNFDKDKDYMLSLAQKYKDETSWVFKPHPLLGKHCVKNGVFPTMEEYYNYVRKWDELSNAQSAEGDYMPIFTSSDCMIFDSVSFMGEYLYVHKPMLFLTRDTQEMNAFGKKILSVLYTCDGADFQGIEEFILHNVDNDCMKEKREVLFSKYLDYYSETGTLANENIYREIVQGIFGEPKA